MDRQALADLGKTIRTARRDWGVPRRRLADIVDISDQTLASIEAGRTDPRLLVAHALARFLQASLDDWCHLPPQQCPKRCLTSPLAHDLLALYANLPLTQQRQVLFYISRLADAGDTHLYAVEG
jgi:DNA-binding XRE family transcriptional regulator